MTVDDAQQQKLAMAMADGRINFNFGKCMRECGHCVEKYDTCLDLSNDNGDNAGMGCSVGLASCCIFWC